MGTKINNNLKEGEQMGTLQLCERQIPLGTGELGDKMATCDVSEHFGLRRGLRHDSIDVGENGVT